MPTQALPSDVGVLVDFGELGGPNMKRTYKFRLCPTSKQHVALKECLDVHRNIYNAALQERRDAYQIVVRNSPDFYSENRPKSPVNFASQCRLLTELRAEFGEIARFGSHSEQATLRRLDLSFQAFFRRLALGETPGYPRFKAAHRFDTVTWPREGNGAKWHPESSRIYLMGIGYVKVKQYRKVQGIVKTVSITREGKNWYLVLSCDKVPRELLELTHKVVGIDAGIANFVTTSDGEFIANPRYTKQAEEQLAEAQRVLALKKPRSKNRSKARATVAKIHRKISDQRRDFHHKVANSLVARYDVVVIEDLKIKNMTKSASGTVEDPGTNVAAKSGLNRSINDAGWGQFFLVLGAKAEKAGRLVLKVNPRYTSQMCHECGYVDPGNRVTQATFKCLACGHEVHADVNGAKNMKRAGLALLAAT